MNTQEPIQKGVVRKIENHMAAKAIKRKELADALGITYQTLERRMSGEVAFTIEEIWTIASTLRTNPFDLLPAAGAENLAAAS